MRKIISVILALILFATVFAGEMHIYALDEGDVTFGFSDAIIYGGTAADDGDRIYYSDENNGGALSVRMYGSEISVVLCDKSVSSINVSGGRVYFLAEGAMWACCTDGSALTKLYNDPDMTSLYVSGNYAYFMRGDSVYRLVGGKACLVFSDKKMEAFKPLTPSCFEWYASDPEYYVDACGGASTDSEYVAYRYDTALRASTPVPTETVTAAIEYTGPYVTVGNATLPLKEHMPGTYFTKNGKACTCHNRGDCVNSPPECNCMRYYPTGNAATCEVDLLGCQCFGFSRLVFYKCFGFIDHDTVNPGMSYSVGSLSRGSVTASTVKELLMKAKPGAHVRLSFGHSFSILEMDNEGITIYHANAGGDGVVSSPCVISTRYMTWQAMATWAAAGVAYIRMPTDYPGYRPAAEPLSTGWYVTDNFTNIRVGAGVTFDKTGRQYASGVLINIIETADNGAESESSWGKTDLGWVCLDYCTFVSNGDITVSDGKGFSLTESKMIIASSVCESGALLSAAKGSYLVVKSQSGRTLADTDPLPTDAVLCVEYSGKVLYEFKVAVMGDINCNGHVDVGDYLAIKRVYYGKLQVDGARAVAADLSGDGSIGTDDWLILVKRLAE